MVEASVSFKVAFRSAKGRFRLQHTIVNRFEIARPLYLASFRGAKGDFGANGAVHFSAIASRNPSSSVENRLEAGIRPTLSSTEIPAEEIIPMHEFHDVRESAYDSLRLGTRLRSLSPVRVCQFLILPSFEDAVSWDVVPVIPRDSAPETRLYHSCWRMELDARALGADLDFDEKGAQPERLHHPRPYVPTIEIQWCPIGMDQVQKVLAPLRTISIPLTLDSPVMGCDGVTYEFSVEEFLYMSRITWWNDLPKEWQPLEPVVDALRRLFEQTWAAAEANGPGLRSHSASR